MSKPVAVITGSARRLGKRIALSLAKHGFNIVVNYNNSFRQAEIAKNAISAAGADVITVKADVTSEKDVKRLVKMSIKSFGKIDLLVNNAAIFPEKFSLSDLPVSVWDDVMNTNLKSVFLCSKYFSQEMQKNRNGKIINIASLGSFLNWTGYIPYCVSKSGVVVLTKLLAKSLAPNIQVNAVAPGTIIIPGEESHIKRVPSKNKILLKRYGQPDDIENMVLFLATQGDYITGQVFTIDGGSTIL